PPPLHDALPISARQACQPDTTGAAGSRPHRGGWPGRARERDRGPRCRRCGGPAQRPSAHARRTRRRRAARYCRRSRLTVPVPVMSERRTALVGGLMVAIGPVSMALYTPALPALVQAFDTSEAVVKLSLTVYFAGFSFAQLVCGPLSDAFGRRPISVGFLVLYIAASLVAVFAPTIEWLLAARLVQGIGASVGVAISRAIVRDQYIGQTSARIMNAIAMTLALGPAVSPTLGGLVLEASGWHGSFWLMVAFGVALVVLVLTGLPETNRTLDRAAVRPVRLLRTYVSLLGDRRFLRPSLAIALTIGVFYTLAT